MLFRDPYTEKEKLKNILGNVHDFTWDKIIKTERGPNIIVIAKEALTDSIRDIVSEKFSVKHDLVKEIAHIISEQDWSYTIGQHAAAKLVILRGLQLSGLNFSPGIYGSRFWLSLVCQEFMRFEGADKKEGSPLEELFLRASNDLEDHESKQLILSRADTIEIQQRAEKLLYELTLSYFNSQANDYEQAPLIQECSFENAAA